MSSKGMVRNSKFKYNLTSMSAENGAMYQRDARLPTPLQLSYGVEVATQINCQGLVGWWYAERGIVLLHDELRSLESRTKSQLVARWTGGPVSSIKNRDAFFGVLKPGDVIYADSYDTICIGQDADAFLHQAVFLGRLSQACSNSGVERSPNENQPDPWLLYHATNKKNHPGRVWTTDLFLLYYEPRDAMRKIPS